MKTSNDSKRRATSGRRSAEPATAVGHEINKNGENYDHRSSDQEQVAEFALTPESTGFTGTAPVEIRQDYPASERQEICQPGAVVRRTALPETAVVLRVQPVNEYDGTVKSCDKTNETPEIG